MPECASTGDTWTRSRRNEMPAEIIAAARRAGAGTLSEHDSKRLIAAYGVPVSREELVKSAGKAAAAALRIGYPVALKACSPALTHKTEMDVIALNVGDEAALLERYAAITARAGADIDGVLVQEMVSGGRELTAGLVRDATFGPTVMLGLGGVFAEALEDVAFGIAPLEKRDVAAMAASLKSRKLLGEFRGMPPVDMDALGRILIALGRLGLDFPEIKEIDVNPLIIRGGSPVAVDALVVLE